MVQYLYAVSRCASSTDPNRQELAAQNLLTQIAREEIGHLATV